MKQESEKTTHFGYREVPVQEKARLVHDVFRSVAGKAPSDIISALNRAAAEWRGEQPQNDDMTFVAIRVRD